MLSCINQLQKKNPAVSFYKSFPSLFVQDCFAKLQIGALRPLPRMRVRVTLVQQVRMRDAVLSHLAWILLASYPHSVHG